MLVKNHSPVTSVYNDALRAAFGSDLELVIIDRLSAGDEVVSATRVRAAIQDKKRRRVETARSSNRIII